LKTAKASDRDRSTHPGEAFGMPSRPFAADDFDAIRTRLDELKQGRSAAQNGAAHSDYDFTYFHNGQSWCARPLSERAKRGSVNFRRDGNGIISGEHTTEAVKDWMKKNQYTYIEVSNEDKI
jgi:hypothetical protein